MIDDLGAYVATRPWWRWLPGMVCADGCRALRVLGDEVWWIDGDDARGTPTVTRMETCPVADVPDMADPATLGAILLGLAPDVCGGPVSLIGASWADGLGGVTTEWTAHAAGSRYRGHGATRARAIVSLLDMAHDGET